MGRLSERAIIQIKSGLLTAVAVVFACLVVITQPAIAADPADGDIKAAVYDLDRVAKQLPSLTPKRKANIKRLLRSLDLAAERLGKSQNQSHASWTDAKARLDDYRKQLETLMAGGTAPPEPATQEQAPATQTQTTEPSGDQPPRMTSSDVSKFNRLVRNYNSIATNLQAIDPKILHGQRELSKWRGQFERLNQSMASFEPFMADPNVAQLATNIADMTAAYRQIEAQSLAALEALGDIPAQLKVLLARYERDKLPQALEEPYEEDRVNRWAQYILKFTEQANTDAAWLTKVRATTNQHDFDVKNALNGTVGHQAKNAISNAVTKTREKIYQPLQKIQHGEVAHVAKLTLEDKDKIRNSLLGEGRYEMFMADIRNALEAIEHGKRIDAALGQQTDPAVEQLTQNINAMRTRIDTLFETVLSEVRMPPARSDDGELLDAAAQVLSRDQYGFTWERMVINSGLKEKEETRAWWRGETVIAATYRWKEFQVATAEKVGDKYYIFYNLLHYYTSGDSTTPVDKWILNKRFQSNRILAENIAE